MTNTTKNWKADHLRVSIFSTRIIQESVESIYETVTGVLPADINQKPATGESIATGIFDELRFEVRRSFNRVDFIIQPIPLPTLQVSLIRDLESCIKKLKQTTYKYIGNKDDLIRIAFGGNHLYEVENPVEAYKKLSSLTGQNFIFGKHKDVIFQINIPSKSTAKPGLSINRLTHWVSPTITINQISESTASKTHFFCGCVADFNTDAENKSTFEPKYLEPIIEELALEMLTFVQSGVSL